MRYDPLKDTYPFFQDFIYQMKEKKSVLEALMDIRNEQDCTLSFRYSCCEAICGSCAMVINGKFDLACRAELELFESSLIVIEPLPNLEIQKDLLVDMDSFFEAVRKIEPYIQPEGGLSGEGYRIEEKEKIVPSPKDIKESTGIYVFVGWIWLAVFVLVFFLRLKIKEVDRLYRLGYFSGKKK
jgi:succinate dehydrogenase / fumarate reductase iron-sulfur subunit